MARIAASIKICLQPDQVSLLVCNILNELFELSRGTVSSLAALWYKWHINVGSDTVSDNVVEHISESDGECGHVLVMKTLENNQGLKNFELTVSGSCYSWHSLFNDCFSF